MFAQMFPGMEWIPAMIAVTVGALVCGAISIGASVLFTNSRFGFRCGILAVVIGVLSPPLFFCLTASGMLWHAYAVLASPALPGVLGVWLSRTRGRTLGIARILIVSVTIAGAAALAYQSRANAIAGQQMMALLSGNEQVEIVSFRVEHQQRRVICADRVVCDHVARSLRGAISDSDPGGRLRLGASYSFTFQFNSGSRYRAAEACVFDGGFSASIPEANPFHDAVMTHEVHFQEPMPERLRQIWGFLHEPWEKVAGSVMIVEDGCPVRIEYDRRLDAEGRHAP